MLLTDHFPPVIPDALQGVLTTRLTIDSDVEPVAKLLEADRRRLEPEAEVDRQALATRMVGPRSWSCRQVVVVPARTDGTPLEGAAPVAWFKLEDHAAGRTNSEWVIPEDLPHREELARALFEWGDLVAGAFARHRGVDTTIIVDGADTRDEDRLALMRLGGYECARTWLNMERPVTPGEGHSLPAPRENVRVRRVRLHESGLPIARDVRWVHIVLEESFEDHFNSYRESFTEFTSRVSGLRNTAWDHWWIAEVQGADGMWRPGGGLVARPLAASATDGEGTYLEYLGVHRTARGHGIAKALLRAAIADADERGRVRVGLDVDADSPTGADGLYRSMGFETRTTTESWHREVPSRPSNLFTSVD